MHCIFFFCKFINRSPFLGNTSQYIGDDNNTSVGITHKWLIYVKTKTDVPIEQMICKVRFFLHPSYKPNDVIEVK